jgi:beta-lactamase class A
MRPFVILIVILSSSVCNVDAIAETALQVKVESIAAEARGTVSVSCLLPGTTLNCDLHPHNHSPMQSVFKYPLAVTVLHFADIGKLLPAQRPVESLNTTLNRTVRFLP